MYIQKSLKDGYDKTLSKLVIFYLYIKVDQKLTLKNYKIFKLKDY